MADLIPAGIGPLVQTSGSSLSTDQSDSSWLSSTWWQQLQPGSWRGVGFIMDVAETRAGRRTATHEYPYRDTVWVEDLGRLPRRFQVTAFLTGDDVYQQRDAMIRACEQPGNGTLVHPTLGSVQCVLIEFSVIDRREHGRIVEIALSFVVSGDILFPTASIATGEAVYGAGAAVNRASADDLAATLGEVPSVPPASILAIPQFGALAINAVNDPARSLAAVVGLQGFYGRYAAGRAATLQSSAATVTSALAQSITSRQGVLAAVAALDSAAVAL